MHQVSFEYLLQLRDIKQSCIKYLEARGNYSVLSFYFFATNTPFSASELSKTTKKFGQPCYTLQLRGYSPPDYNIYRTSTCCVCFCFFHGSYVVVHNS